MHVHCCFPYLICPPCVLAKDPCRRVKRYPSTQILSFPFIVLFFSNAKRQWRSKLRAFPSCKVATSLLNGFVITQKLLKHKTFNTRFFVTVLVTEVTPVLQTRFNPNSQANSWHQEAFAGFVHLCHCLKDFLYHQQSMLLL